MLMTKVTEHRKQAGVVRVVSERGTGSECHQGVCLLFIIII